MHNSDERTIANTWVCIKELSIKFGGHFHCNLVNARTTSIYLSETNLKEYVYEST